ncbi:16S rRNA (uracil(1498)-N(3))-methyltransferase [Virgibacillus sp. C22-A2]|uniref:Ribosomal RNA small subunit methyltransferase E n=1 Tax=Virgibacillus tibetensis TaxID=3042313 RepID=A0ABU6KAT6_9BACI|nr:16S rRNA (uracil(1498)-N(3))-methyltransferase [Virgibacillus sp. C22-A2]
MQRYFVHAEDWNNNEVIVRGDDAHHINKVMRSKNGDAIICNNPKGQAAICEIVSIESDHIKTVVKEWLEEAVELPIDVTIAQGLPKGDKFDFVLQKGTELGANAFIPFQAERSIVVWDSKKMNKKMERFTKIVKEASEQSHRNRIPFIHPTMSIDELLKESENYDVKIFAYEEEAKVSNYHSFGTVIENVLENQRLFVCIGPEGGFTAKEAELLKAEDFSPVRLGPRILRTETAALYVLASISYHYEELRCN